MTSEASNAGYALSSRKNICSLAAIGAPIQKATHDAPFKPTTKFNLPLTRAGPKSAGVRCVLSIPLSGKGCRTSISTPQKDSRQLVDLDRAIAEAQTQRKTASA